MRKMDFNGRKLCQLQGKLFEESIEKVSTSSLIFIRRFMLSNLVKQFDDSSFLVTALDSQDCFYEIEKEYGKSNYGKIKYSKDEMFWIGYIYRAIAILYNLPSKKVFSLFNAKDIITYYNIYHTFEIEQAAEKMMESIDYKVKDYNREGYKILKKLINREKMEKMLGEEVIVYVDRPIGSIHPNHNDIVYNANYGYIKELVAADKEYQDAYVLGNDEPIEYIKGKAYAIVERENDIEDKLVVVVNNNEYTIEEIKEKIAFQEKFFKSKIKK